MYNFDFSPLAYMAAGFAGVVLGSGISLLLLIASIWLAVPGWAYATPPAALAALAMGAFWYSENMR